MSNGVPTINSGVVHAPVSGSQATQDPLRPPYSQARTTEAAPRHPDLASQQEDPPDHPRLKLDRYAYEIGIETGRRRPFLPAMNEMQRVEKEEAAASIKVEGK